MFALIGNGWASARDETGNKRLNNPNDFVRIELEAAVGRKILLIPLLIDDSPFPRADDLFTPISHLRYSEFSIDLAAGLKEA